MCYNPSMAAPTTVTRETIQTSRLPPAALPPSPAYFLSLTVVNFRCFGQTQTLDAPVGQA